MSEIEQGYFCKICGEHHEELPMSYGSPVPDYCEDIPEEEWESRIEMNEDLCIVDDEHFFIRGAIEIPVTDDEGPFIWDIWVSLSESNFELTTEYWATEGRERKLDPMFGWLSTSIPCYPETLELKTMVHTRSVGMRPFIELEPTSHPMAIEQRNGITMDRIKKIAEELCQPDE
ncbi:DUF2199 domain-containing protein [Planococcus faecalis]|uniref:DUF2199 domain-containing protein n=1 Tax=Planococcus faecalis TaxID=1598147 RepID=A0ABN4XLY5_9BACL|nr:DUF2199 domain-containing protein [Planococcus faecalis]AQU79538.1 hypothetical protein AJGP001_09830 [Planococcus faecalis]OHX53160.1 hypothetical protein BB777_10890 [Planococcus faecalis]